MTECTTATVSDKLSGVVLKITVPRGADLFIDLPFAYQRAKLRARGTTFQKDLFSLMKAKQGSHKLPTRGGGDGGQQHAFLTSLKRKRMNLKGPESASEKPVGTVVSAAAPSVKKEGDDENGAQLQSVDLGRQPSKRIRVQPEVESVPYHIDAKYGVNGENGEKKKAMTKDVAKIGGSFRPPVPEHLRWKAGHA